MTKKSEQVVKGFLKLSKAEQNEVLKRLNNLEFSIKIINALSIQKIKKAVKLTSPGSKTAGTGILNKRTTHGIVLGPLNAAEPLPKKKR
jgi:beta-lactamase class D